MPTYRPLYVGLQYSEALADAYVHTPADDPVLVTLELHHTLFSEPIRVVNDWETLAATLEDDAPINPSEEVDFAGIPFTFVRPAETDSGAPAAVSVVVDNLSTIITQMIMDVQESDEPILVLIRTYLRTDTSAPHELPVLRMFVQSPVSIDSSSARLSCSFGDLTNRRFPGLLYKRASSPVAVPGPVSWSPTFKGPTIILSDGNLTATDPSDSMETYSTVRATVAPTSGKWYWEIVVNSLDEILDLFVGIITTDADWNTRFVANFPRYCYRSTGARYDGSVTDGAYPEMEVGDNVGIGWDVDADKVWYRLNGSWLDGDPATGLDPSSEGEVTIETMTPSVGFDNNVGLAGVTAKFDADDWTYVAPTGFLELEAP